MPDARPATLQSGSTGPLVKCLQAALNFAGAAPPLKLDGDYGPKTKFAVLAYQDDRKMPATGVADTAWLANLDYRELVVATPAPTPAPAPVPPAAAPDVEKMTDAEFEAFMIDRRAFHNPMTRDANRKLVPYKPTKRELTSVTGICLHQTACDMGTNPERYDTISVHFVVLRNGKILWICDEDWILWAANDWNNRTVSIEVNGLYSGLLDDPRTAHDEALATTWDDPTTAYREKPQDFTELIAASLRRLVRWIKSRVDRRAAALKPAQTETCRFLVTHRQSSGSRQNDPGQAIARVGVALQLELGMTDGSTDPKVGFKVGNGRPNPEAWDPRAVGIKY